MRFTHQQYTILEHFRRAKRLSGRTAVMDYGIAALPKRISELREMGFKIDARWKKHPATGQRYREYELDHPAAGTVAV